MKRSKWNTFDVIDRVGPCNALMVVGQKRWQVAEALIVAIYVAAEELKALPDTTVYVCDDGWGNSLVLREPVPELFVEALLNGIPGARVVPIDFQDSPTRLLMTLGKRGVEVHGDPVVPGYVGPAPEGNRWDSYGEHWGSEWSASRYYAYRKRKTTQTSAAAPKLDPVERQLEARLTPPQPTRTNRLARLLMPTRRGEPASTSGPAEGAAPELA